MTDEELRELVAENSRAIREMQAARKKSDREMQAFREEMRAADRRAEELRAESERRMQAFREEMRAADRRTEELRFESERRMQAFQEEMLASRREVDRVLTNIERNNRDLGRLGNRFGEYNEALCRPSLIRTLRERFHMTEFAPRMLGYHNGDAVELDLLAHADHRSDEVYVAEIKNRLRQEGIDQILEHLKVFPRFFPDHRGKKLYGILAAIEAEPQMQKKVLQQGLYLMLYAGDVLEMRVPEGFEPQVFPTT